MFLSIFLNFVWIGAVQYNNTFILNTIATKASFAMRQLNTHTTLILNKIYRSYHNTAYMEIFAPVLYSPLLPSLLPGEFNN